MSTTRDSIISQDLKINTRSEVTEKWAKIAFVNILTPISVTAVTLPFRYFQTRKQVLSTAEETVQQASKPTKAVTPISQRVVAMTVKAFEYTTKNGRMFVWNYINSLKAAFTKSVIIVNSKPISSSIERALNAREVMPHEEIIKVKTMNKVMATMLTGMLVGVPDALNPFTNLSILNSLHKNPQFINWGQIWQVNKVGFGLRYGMNSSNAVFLLYTPILQEQISALFPKNHSKRMDYAAGAAATGLTSILASIFRMPLSTLHKNLVDKITFTEDSSGKVANIETPTLKTVTQHFSGNNIFKLWRGASAYVPVIFVTFAITNAMPDVAENALTYLKTRGLFAKQDKSVTRSNTQEEQHTPGRRL